MNNIKLNPKWISLTPTDRLHEMEVPVIGLTGGIATGKSTYANWMKKQGVCVIGADDLVKKIYQYPETLEWAKSQNLPLKNESIDFKSLRELFFNDDKLKYTIEQYIYSHLKNAFKVEWKNQGSPNWIIYDVPLLFERQLDLFFDQVLLIYAPKNIQIERLLKRDNISEELAEKIIDQQMSIETKKISTQWIIDNSEDDIKPENNPSLLKIWSELIVT